MLHLKVRNHGPGFWAEMAAALPDYMLRRTRLKEFGRRVSF